MKSNRSKNSFRNLLYGTGAQFIQTIFPFISRTIFIYYLGESFLGINSLFSSILSVLSLAELGIGNIVVYSLYKPLANNEKDKILSLIKFYRKIYSIIALVVFVLGISVLPILQYIVNLPNDVGNVKLYYFLFLFNTSVSYLMIYKMSLINADQKQYIISIYKSISTIILTIIEIMILIFTKNYLLYLIIQIIITITTNIMISIKANKLYNLKLKNVSPISQSEKKQIFSDTRAMLSYKLGGTFLNSTDSIYISTLIDTISVGLYANYTALEQILNKFINLIYDSIYASVGNLNATENVEKQKEIFESICLIFNTVGTIGLIGFILCSSNIINLWIGEKYIINFFAIIALGIRFYMPIVLYPIWMYRNSTGIFKETKNILIYAGLLNIIFSYFFGKIWGLAGILLATSFSRLLTSFWYEPYILYKKLFKSSCFEYFKNILLCIVIATITIIIGIKVGITLNFNIICDLILKIFISVVLPFLTIIIIYHKSIGFKYIYNNLIKKRFKKRKIC